MLPTLLRQPRARAHRRRDDPRRHAKRLSFAVAPDPARIPRVRAHVDHGGERLYRPEGRRLCQRAQFELRQSRISRRAVDHALERRRHDARSCNRAARRHDGVGAGRRHHRFGAGRARARPRQRHLLRHGRYHGEGKPRARRGADDGAGLLRRRLCQGPSRDAADD